MRGRSLPPPATPAGARTGATTLTNPTVPPPAVSRTDTSAVEPRYLAALEAERADWWS